MPDFRNIERNQNISKQGVQSEIGRENQSSSGIGNQQKKGFKSGFKPFKPLDK